jgi:hypothetical protein
MEKTFSPRAKGYLMLDDQTKRNDLYKASVFGFTEASAMRMNGESDDRAANESLFGVLGQKDTTQRRQEYYAHPRLLPPQKPKAAD